MSEKVKALIWEECRVAGAITLTCWLSSTLFVLSMAMSMPGLRTFQQNPVDFYIYAFGIPMFTALLLLLNPDTSGALRGGYSRRILQLPIQTWTTVTVTLITRTVFIGAMGLMVGAASHFVVESAPVYLIIVFALFFYLTVQLLDWMRGVISGLHSLIIAMLLVLSFFWFKNGSMHELNRTVEHISSPDSVGMPALFFWLAIFALSVYGLSLLIVSATRKGKVYGFPEVWQWRLPFSVPVGKVLRPFDSPIAAQVWLDLRRSKLLLPVITILGTGLAYVVSILANDNSGNGSFHMYWGLLVPLGVMTLGVFAQGLVLNVLGWRRTKGLPGYTYLVPMTDAQIAYARIITHAILFLPAILFVTVIQHTVPSTKFIADLLPQALDAGIVSVQEAAWTLVARSYLAGLVLWAIMAVSTRIIGKALGAGIVISILLVAADLSGLLRSHYLHFILPAGVLVVGLAAFTRAYRGGIIGIRSLLFWGAVWIVTSWPFLGRSLAEVQHFSGNALHYAVVIVSSLAIGTLAPLPFAAIALDVRKRRHSAAPRKDTPAAAHVRDAGRPINKRWVAAGTALVLAIVWIGLPLPWTYKDAWRAKGYPATLDELDAWYEAVPDEENRALKYLAVADKAERLGAAYQQEANEALRESNGKKDYWDSLYIQGNAQYHPNNGIDPKAREGTVAYWQAFTSNIAPQLVEIANDESAGSRYPVDLKEGFSAMLEHLAKTRNLARNASLDSMYWSMNDDPERAAESALAIFPIADSLSEEPILISGLVRIAILQTALNAVNTSLNITLHNESTLTRMQTELEQRLETFEQNPLLFRAMVGESVMNMNTLAYMPQVLWTNYNSFHPFGSDASVFMPHSLATLPRASEIAVSGVHFERMIDVTQGTWQEVQNVDETDEWEDVGSMAILSWILLPALGRAEEASWRTYTQFDLAITGIALERYRLANGDYPDSLNRLVPEFLDEVPLDRLDPEGNPLRYRTADDGGVIVYSVSRDGEDDGGENKENQSYWLNGDIIFELYPRKSNDLEYIPPPEEP